MRLATFLTTSIVSLFMLSACGEKIYRRTIDTPTEADGEPESHSGDKKLDKPKGKRPLPGTHVTTTLGLAGQLVPVRPPVDYHIFLDSSGSMAETAIRVVDVFNAIADAIVADQAANGIAAKDTITLHMNSELFNNNIPTISNEIRVVEVGNSLKINGTEDPLRNNPYLLLFPYALTVFKALDANPVAGREGSAIHMIVSSDGDLQVDKATADYLRNSKRPFALTAVNRFVDTPPSTECRATYANYLATTMTELEAIGRTGGKIDICDPNFATNTANFATVVAATNYQKWIFPEMYHFGEDIDYTKPIVVKVDGAVIEADQYEVVTISNAIRFKPSFELIGKTLLTVSYTTLPAS